MDVSCIALAGGKSTRLGRNKLAERIGEKSLLERVIDILTCLNGEIILVTAKDSDLPQFGDHSEVKIVEDIFPGKGSIGGIYTGLVISNSFYNLVIACDMPFLNPNLLKYMIAVSEGYDVVVPRIKGEIFEPLHAVYSKNCIEPLERLIKNDVFRIIELYPLVKVKYLDDSEIEKFDPQKLSFFNINTENELRAGREIAGREGIHRDKC